MGARPDNNEAKQMVRAVSPQALEASFLNSHLRVPRSHSELLIRTKTQPLSYSARAAVTHLWPSNGKALSRGNERLLEAKMEDQASRTKGDGSALVSLLGYEDHLLPSLCMAFCPYISVCDISPFVRTSVPRVGRGPTLGTLFYLSVCRAHLQMVTF